jgi:predicted transcriptional regulator
MVREFLSFNDEFYTESSIRITNLPQATRMEYLERFVQNLCCSIAIAAMGGQVFKTTNEIENTNPIIFSIDPTILEADKQGNNQIQVRRFLNE